MESPNRAPPGGEPHGTHLEGGLVCGCNRVGEKGIVLVVLLQKAAPCPSLTYISKIEIMQFPTPSSIFKTFWERTCRVGSLLYKSRPVQMWHPEDSCKRKSWYKPTAQSFQGLCLWWLAHSSPRAYFNKTSLTLLPFCYPVNLYYVGKKELRLLSFSI